MKDDKMQARVQRAVADIPTQGTPVRLVEYLRDEIKAGASRFELHQRNATVGGALALTIQSYEKGAEFERVNDAEGLADRIFRRATEEHAACALVGTNAYQVAAFRKELAGAVGSIGFKVMPSEESDASTLGPGMLDVVKQTTRHLEEREQTQTAILLQAVAATHMGRNDTSAAWQAITKGHEELNKQTRESSASLLADARADNKRLQDELTRLQNHQFQSALLLEELISKKHERDLDTTKAARQEDRKDKIVKDIFIDKVLPAVAMKFGLLGPKKPEAKAGDVAGGSAPPKSATLTLAQSRALGAFLTNVGQEELLAMREAVSEGTRERLDALVLAFSDDAGADDATTNGVTNGAVTNGATNGAHTS
jgi:hypothetical protein